MASGGALVRLNEDGPSVPRALAFSPNGKGLASGMLDGTVLIWYVKQDFTEEKQDHPPAPEDFEAFWSDLADEDARKAHHAMWKLAGAGERVMEFVKQRLEAPAGIEEKAARLVADLDSDEFTVREKAEKELERLGPFAEQALKKVITKSVSAEMQMRADRLVKALDRGIAIPSGEGLRRIRSVWLLEQIGTKPARDVLEHLARTSPSTREARLAREAAARLDSQRPDGR
jgi:hypothetical protein